MAQTPSFTTLLHFYYYILTFLLLLFCHMAGWINRAANDSVVLIDQSELQYYLSLANKGLRVFIYLNTFFIRSFDLYVSL